MKKENKYAKAKLGTTIDSGDKEVTEDRYYDMLGAVPPIYFSFIDNVNVRGGFAVGEAYSHTNKGEATYYGFYQVGDKYYETFVKFVRKNEVVRIAQSELFKYDIGGL